METVTISKEEYLELKKDSLLLEVLQNSGVDNWTWYGEALSEYQEILKKEGLED